MNNDPLNRPISELTPRERELLAQIMEKLDRIDQKLTRMLNKSNNLSEADKPTSQTIFYEGWVKIDDVMRN